MRRKSRKRKTKNRTVRSLDSNIANNIRQLHQDPLASETFQGWEAIDSPGAPEMVRIAKIQDGIVKASADILHTPNLSVLMVRREASEEITRRELRVTASTGKTKGLGLREEESYPGIPEVYHGFHTEYHVNGRMYMWCPFNGFESDDGDILENVHSVRQSSSKFLNAPKDCMYTAKGGFHAHQGPLHHRVESQIVRMPKKVVERPELLACVTVNPTRSITLHSFDIKPEAKHEPSFGPFPLQLTKADIDDLIKVKMKELLFPEDTSNEIGVVIVNTWLQQLKTFMEHEEHEEAKKVERKLRERGVPESFIYRHKAVGMAAQNEGEYMQKWN